MTTAKERYEVLSRLERAGIDPVDARTLRRIALTLHRWHELECGTGQGMVERDETTGKPYWVGSYDTPRNRWPMPDREKGALARLKEVMRRYSRKFRPYVQGDPRGASLYLVPHKDVPKGKDIDAYYSNGIAIY